MRWLIVSIGLFLIGCTTAGPFVTNISSDGKGGLIIEKTRIQYNAFTDTVGNKDSSTTKIQVIPESLLKKMDECNCK